MPLYADLRIKESTTSSAEGDSRYPTSQEHLQLCLPEFLTQQPQTFPVSSLRNLMQTSNVAPPQHSMESYPIESITSAIGSISSVFILVAIRDWCASLSTVSVNFNFLFVAKNHIVCPPVYNHISVRIHSIHLVCINKNSSSCGHIPQNLSTHKLHFLLYDIPDDLSILYHHEHHGWTCFTY